MTRNLEVIKDKGNYQSRLTVTSERITIKLAEGDVEDEPWFVSTALKAANQIPEDTAGLRGKFVKSDEYFALDNKAKSYEGLVKYTFEISAGRLLGIKEKGE